MNMPTPSQSARASPPKCGRQEAGSAPRGRGRMDPDHLGRVQGIAAPEGNEPGGDIAAEAMRDLVLGKELRCDLTGDRSHDRVIGVCFLADGRDVGEVMVFEGHARDCYRFSRGRYAARLRYIAWQAESSM